MINAVVLIAWVAFVFVVWLGVMILLRFLNAQEEGRPIESDEPRWRDKRD